MANAHVLEALLKVRLDAGAARAAGEQAKRELGNVSVPVSFRIDPRAAQAFATIARDMGGLKAQAAAVTGAASAAAASVDRFGGSAARASSQANAAQAALAAQARAYKAVSAAAAEGATAAEQFGTRVGQSGARLAAFMTASTGVFALVRALKAAASEAAAFDLNLNKLRQVSDESNRTVRETADAVLTLSRNLGVSSKEMVGAAVTFKQAGFSLKQVKEATEAVGLTQLAASFDGAAQSAEGAIAAFQQFGKGSSSFKDQLGAMSAVSNAFAAEARDLVVGVQKAGGAFASAGSDLNEFLALMTSVRSTTRESAESIATGLRSLTSYFQRGSSAGAVKELGESFRYTYEEAKALGDPSLQSSFKGMYESVRVLNSALANVRTTDPRYSSVVESLGGVRQLGRLIPLVQQYGEAQKALAVARTGAATLDVNREQADSRMLTRLTRVREEWQKVANEAGQGRGVQKLVEQFENLATQAARFADALAPMLPVLAGAGLGRLAAGGLGFAGAAGSAALGARPAAAPGPRRYASGGWVVPGTGETDSVPAELPAGSFVLRKRVAQGLRRAGRAAPAVAALLGGPNPDALAPQNLKAVAEYERRTKVLLTPGELVVGPDDARRIGYGTLGRLNRAGGETPARRYAAGGRVDGPTDPAEVYALITAQAPKLFRAHARHLSGAGTSEDLASAMLEAWVTQGQGAPDLPALARAAANQLRRESGVDRGGGRAVSLSALGDVETAAPPALGAGDEARLAGAAARLEPLVKKGRRSAADHAALVAGLRDLYPDDGVEGLYRQNRGLFGKASLATVQKAVAAQTPPAELLAPHGVLLGPGASLPPKAARGLASLAGLMPAGAAGFLRSSSAGTQILPGLTNSRGDAVNGLARMDSRTGASASFLDAGWAAKEGAAAASGRADRSTLLHERLHEVDQRAGFLAGARPSVGDDWRAVAPAAVDAIARDRKYTTYYGGAKAVRSRFTDPEGDKGLKEAFAEAGSRYLVAPEKLPGEVRDYFRGFFQRFEGGVYKVAAAAAKEKGTALALPAAAGGGSAPPTAGASWPNVNWGRPGFLNPVERLLATMGVPRVAAPLSVQTVWPAAGPGTPLPPGAGPGRSAPLPPGFTPAGGAGGGKPPQGPPVASGGASPAPDPNDPNAWYAKAAAAMFAPPGNDWRRASLGYALTGAPAASPNVPLMANHRAPFPAPGPGVVYRDRYGNEVSGPAAPGGTVYYNRDGSPRAPGVAGEPTRSDFYGPSARGWGNLEQPARPNPRPAPGAAVTDVRFADLLSADTARRARGMRFVSEATSNRFADEALLRRNRELEAAVAEQLRTKGASRREARLGATEFAADALANNRPVMTDDRGRVVGLPHLGGPAAARSSWGGRVNRGWNAARESFSFDRGGAGWYALSAGGAILGDQIGPGNKRYEMLARGGDETAGGLKRQAAVGGLLQGAATGASVGLAFGAPGLAIGAVAGAAFGLANSLQDAADKIREAKLDKAVDDLGTTISKLSSGRLNFAEGGGDLTAQLREARATVDNKARAAATGYFVGPTAEGLAASRLRESRLGLGPQLSGLYLTAQRQAEEIGKKNPTLDVGGAERALAGTAAFRELVGALTDVNQFKSASEGFREFAKEAVKAGQAERVRAAMEKSRGQVEAVSLALGRLAEGAENAGAAVAAAGGKLASLEALAGGGEVPLADPAKFFRPGVSGFAAGDKGLEILRASGGRAGTQLADELSAAARVRDVLPDVLGPLARSADMKESVGAQARKGILAQLGLTEAALAGNRSLARAVDFASTETEGYAEKNKETGGLRGVVDRGADAAAADLMQPLTEGRERAAADTLGPLGRRRTEFSAGLARAAALGRLGDDELAQSDAAAREALRTRTALSAPTRVAADELALGQLDAPFLSAQKRLVAGTGAAPADAAGIAGELRRVMSKVEEARLERDRAQYDRQSGAYEAAAQKLEEFRGQTGKLREALKRLGDTAERSAGLQEKLTGVQSSLAGRRGLAERLLFADGPERARLRQGQRDALALADDPARFGEMGRAAQRRALEFLQASGEMRLNARGDRADKLRENLLDRLAGPAQAAEKGEERGLKEQLAKVFDDAAAAAKAQADFSKRLGDEYLAELKAEHDVFLRTFQAGAAKADLGRAKAEENRLLGDQAKLGVAQTDRTRLAALGVTTDDRLKAAKGGEGSLRKAFDLTERITRLSNSPDPEAFQAAALGVSFDGTNSARETTARLASEKAARTMLDRSAVGDDLEGTQKEALSRAVAERWMRLKEEQRKKTGFVVTDDQNRQMLADATRKELPTFRAAQIGAYGKERAGVLSELQDKHGIDAGAALAQAQRVEVRNGRRVATFDASVGKNYADSLGRFDGFGKLDGEAVRLAAEMAAVRKEAAEAAAALAALTGAGKGVAVANNDPNFIGPPVPRAAGGWVPDANNAGRLSRGTDRTLAVLSKDEFVVRSREAKKHRGLLEKINRGDSPVYRADGGPVGEETAFDRAARLAAAATHERLRLADVDAVRERAVAARRARAGANDFGRMDTSGYGALVRGEGGGEFIGPPDPAAELKAGRALALAQAAVAAPDAKAVARRLRMNGGAHLGMELAGTARGRLGLVRDAIAAEGRTARAFADDPSLGKVFGGVVGAARADTEEAFGDSEDGVRSVFASARDRVRAREAKRRDAAFRRMFGLGSARGGPTNRTAGMTSLGLEDKVLGLAGLTPPKRFFSGGVVPGVGQSDSVPAALRPGEGVLTPSGMRAAGGAAGLARLNGGSGTDNSAALEKALLDFGLKSAAMAEKLSKFHDAVGRFVPVADSLTKAMNDMPRQISHDGTFKTEVSLTGGAEILHRLEGFVEELKAALENIAHEAIDRRVPNADQRGANV